MYLRIPMNPETRITKPRTLCVPVTVELLEAVRAAEKLLETPQFPLWLLEVRLDAHRVLPACPLLLCSPQTLDGVMRYMPDDLRSVGGVWETPRNTKIGLDRWGCLWFECELLITAIGDKLPTTVHFEGRHVLLDDFYFGTKETSRYA